MTDREVEAWHGSSFSSTDCLYKAEVYLSLCNIGFTYHETFGSIENNGTHDLPLSVYHNQVSVAQ